MSQSIRDYFVRPHRQTYYNFDLGPSTFFVQGQKCFRKDFEIENVNQHKLKVSYYHFDALLSQNCLIYLHTHNGSKLQALPLLQNILSIGINLCVFDFAGYGNSEGEFVSLGSKQIWDIECVIEHIKETFKQYKFILWGRSMGAVAALLYLFTKTVLSQSQIQIKGMSKQLSVIGGIYDSPFHSLQKLTVQIGSKNMNLPEFLLKPFVYFIKTTLKEEINFEDLELVEKMRHIKIPGLFITSQLDSFVHHSHSELLYKQYKGKKELIYIEKDHNQIRKNEDLKTVYNFIRRLNDQNPKRWETVLMNNLNYHKKFGKSIYSLYPS